MRWGWRQTVEPSQAQHSALHVRECLLGAPVAGLATLPGAAQVQDKIKDSCTQKLRQVHDAFQTVSCLSDKIPVSWQRRAPFLCWCG